ncbi:phosphoglycerate dehydrogenase [Thermoflexibacter ruber]|nr:phosphoglycerate dehydrogenase [Thermoflexibacter ruber]
MKVLLTCPPMIGQLHRFKPSFEAKGVEVIVPKNFVQQLSEEELVQVLPDFDGWIIGDDPVTRRVLEAGKKGKLKGTVRWGIGVDNVDLQAVKDLNIPFSNTPYMFGSEVADLAVAYVIALARHTHLIDKEVKAGVWAKPAGISLAGKTVALIGFGDIGKNVAKRLWAMDMALNIYDPYAKDRERYDNYNFFNFPEKLEEADFVVLACALTPENKHLINANSLAKMKDEVRIVNVSRGGLIDENALIEALKSKKVHSVALDVFEVEPLPMDSPLRQFDNTIFGSHNGSNTIDAVIRASRKAMSLVFEFMGIE